MLLVDDLEQNVDLDRQAMVCLTGGNSAGNGVGGIGLGAGLNQNGGGGFSLFNLQLANQIVVNVPVITQISQVFDISTQLENTLVTASALVNG